MCHVRRLARFTDTVPVLGGYGFERIDFRSLLERDADDLATRDCLWRWGLARGWARLAGGTREGVVQDVDIPLARAGEFLRFLRREIGILPIWLCPLRGSGRFTLYPLRDRELYVSFGFWDTVRSATVHEPGHFNRLVEREVERLAGIKSLYSDSICTRDEFTRAYDLAAYAALKSRYDPCGRLPGLYEKCVLRA